MANFSFSNAYEVNKASTPVGKESNTHDFVFTGLGAVTVDDDTNSRYFSGNDVSAIGINIGGETYYGWISRPIKAQGKVVGFYFWTDEDFVDLDTAQLDGNADGDSDVSDNTGFILVVDQSYFNGLGYKSGSGTTGIKNVGSSSDRVDTALNSLIPANSAPVAVNDSIAFVEDGGAQTGNVLTNDTDANNDTLTVTGFSIGGVAGTLAMPFSINNVGSFTLTADGSYSFTPLADYAGPVPVVTYTVSDGWGGTASASLSITLTKVNDAPAGTDKTITLSEDSSYTFKAADFGFTDTADSPANSLLAVKITTLPAAGTLYLGADPVAADQTIAVGDLGQLKFIPATDDNGSAYASFTFQVQDNGGTSNGGSDLDATPNTITFDVAAANDAPDAAPDTDTAIEDGSAPAGNILDNDSDPDGDTLTVTTAASAVTAATAVGSDTTIAGLYGTLTLSDDGSYSYAVDNTNAAVDALRTAGDTLSETFTYTIADAGGLTSTSTLTITIEGSNDGPSAANDYNVAKETTTDVTGYNATGNVLDNDSDVDDPLLSSKEVTGISISGSATGSTNGTTTFNTTLASPSANSISIGALVYESNGTTPIYETDGVTQVTVTGKSGSGSSVSFTFSDTSVMSGYSAFAVAKNGGGFVAGTIDSTTTTSSTDLGISAPSGTIVVGMEVTGTGIPVGTTVTGVTYDGSGNITDITLSNSVAIIDQELSFSNSTTGTTITGQYGILTLNTDGSYSYTPTSNNPNLSEGESALDSFSYTMKDASNATSSATLTITVLGSGVNDPNAIADTDTATVGAADASGNVLDNDTTPGGTGSLSVYKAHADTTASETAVGTNTTIAGRYGTLTISDDGSYRYAIDTGDTAVVALAAGDTLTETFFYRARNGSNFDDIATLTITINGANDGPTAVADTATATEAGGNGNDIAGYSPSGNLLVNDSDVDTDDTLTVISAAKSGDLEADVTGATIIDGLYGTLTINPDGSYSYAIDNDNATVEALGAGDQLTDVFTYTGEDATGATDGNTLTITIDGANDAPINDLPAAPIFSENVEAPFSGLSVADVDSNALTVTLAVANGILSIGNQNGATLSGNGGATLTLTGSAAQINLALETLSYQGNVHFSGTDQLTMTSSDTKLIDVDTLDITVSADNSNITTSNITVNEASPYAVFTFEGNSDQQQMSLELASGSATSGSDFSPNIEVFDGTDWVAYSGGLVTIPIGESKLFARIPLFNDTTFEDSETFTLTATNKAGLKTAEAIATINDDGSGTIYDGSVNGGSPTEITGDLDDDRELTVSSITVNEASTYAIFSVGGGAGQSITLTLANGTAENADHGTTLQYYVEGSGWLDYGSAATIPAGGVLLVRTTITNDDTYEGPETFGLLATNLGGRSYVGTAVITDDGTGVKYDGSVSGSVPDASSESLDNDLTVDVTAHGPVNEGSPYAMFAIEATAGETLTLTLGNTGSDSDTDATIAGFTLEFSTDGGDTWTTYSAETQPEVPESGQVYVRVDIAGESDGIYEIAETFTLDAEITTGAGRSASATATIVDDGSGTIYDGSLSGGSPTASDSGLDNDNTGLVIGGISGHTTEAGATATFTVRLATQPSADVTITIASDDTGEGTAGPTTLTFTSDNWNVDQTVTVTGVDDLPVDGNISYGVSVVAASGDTRYDGKSNTVTVINDDDDNAGLTLGAISGHTTEDGDTASFTVCLSSQPTADVTITLTSGDGTEGTVGPTILTFTAENWNTPQTVTVTGVDDSPVDGDITYQIDLSASSDDENFQGLNDSVAVINDDNDSFTAPPPPFDADLDPDADDGSSNQDRVTSNIEPDFIIDAGDLLDLGDTAVLLDPDGNLIGAAVVTADDVANGSVKVPTIQLDDGTYVFTAQIRDADGNLKGEAPVTVTIVTDLDGIMPSIELAANGGDFNQDGIADWQQNNVAQLPLTSLADFQAGKNAPESSFGAILAGDVAAGTPGAAVELDDSAQLANISLSAAPIPLPASYLAATPLFNFSVTSQDGKTLGDIDSAHDGLQTRIVIDLPNGVAANTYVKWDAASQSWYEFLDDGNLATYDDGATLLDLNGDGLIDRVVVTLTDGARGDDDGAANGTIVDPGMLALKSATPVYSVLLANGDRFYTTSADEAAAKATGTGNLFEGVRFDSLDSASGGEHIYANYNPFTADWYFAADAQPMPYACYQRVATAGFQAAAAGSAIGEEFHLYMNSAGITQLVTQAEAGDLALSAKGYSDYGAIFSTTTGTAFSFDAEAYLVANKDNAAIQALVQTLAATYGRTSDAGFIDAVEQNYLAQVELVGLSHGSSATAAELNAAFGTTFAA